MSGAGSEITLLFVLKCLGVQCVNAVSGACLSDCVLACSTAAEAEPHTPATSALTSTKH